MKINYAKKVKWTSGDVFAIPLSNGQFAIGQVLDLMMVNQVRIALYQEVFVSVTAIDLGICCQPDNLISLVASSREQLDYGVWEIVGSKPIVIPSEKYLNEQFRAKGWIGAKLYDAGLVEDFLEAFHALRPWDDWFNPAYLDGLLVHPSKKPEKLILVK